MQTRTSSPGSVPTELHSNPNYDLVARFYPLLERCVFGLGLEHARQAFFETALQSDRILLVGEGNGRFLDTLVARKIGGSICVVDQSRVMVRLAKNRIKDQGKTDLKFVQADIRSYTADPRFNCIVTHFFLDQFNPRAQQVIIDRFNELIADNGTWINVDFALPRTMAGRGLMWLVYTFFRIVSRVEARHGFDELAVAAQSGWIVSESVTFLDGFVVAKRYMRRRR